MFSQNPSAPAAENSQLPRETDLSPGQPLQPGMSSSAVGVIGRRSMPDLGAIGDNLTGTSASSGHDQLYNLQMLKFLFYFIGSSVQDHLNSLLMIGLSGRRRSGSIPMKWKRK